MLKLKKSRSTGKVHRWTTYNTILSFLLSDVQIYMRRDQMTNFSVNINKLCNSKNSNDQDEAYGAAVNTLSHSKSSSGCVMNTD